MAHSEIESDYLFKTSCPSCLSSDANAVYTDGHTHCFSCGGHGSSDGHTQHSYIPSDPNFVQGVFRALDKRKITEETCKKFGYQFGEYKGKKCQIAPYYKDGKVVAQKLRFQDKDFKFVGKGTKNPGLFGAQAFRDSGKMLVITEGEIDAMSVSQAQGNKYPVVSVPNGAQGAYKALAKELEYLETFQSIILMFDMDDPGIEAARECAELFTPGKCKIAALPLKDANEMLVAGRGSEIISAIWDAKVYRPEGILSGIDLAELSDTIVETGLSYPWEGLTSLTYGLRHHEIITVLAGSGMGKTEVFKEIGHHIIHTHKKKIGILFLEEQPSHTKSCFISKYLNKIIYIPGVTYSEDEKQEAVHALTSDDQLLIYNHRGTSDFDVIKSKIRYMVNAGAEYIFLDHVTAMAEGKGDSDVNSKIHHIMEELNKLVQNMPFSIFLISHLRKINGTPAEEGGHISLDDAYGSSAIKQRSNFVFALQCLLKDKSEEYDENFRTLRVLKDRFTGRSKGGSISLSYGVDTGRLTEVAKPSSVHSPFSDTDEPTQDF